MSLKSAFDELDLIPENDEMLIPTPENFFKKKNNTDLTDSYEEMTDFNLKIIKNKNWGVSNIEKKDNNRYNRLKALKPQLKDLQKEISYSLIKDKSILRLKVPRLRNAIK